MPTIEEVVGSVADDVIGELKPSEQQLVRDLLLRPRGPRWRDSNAVGFGVSDVAQFMSPYVIAATWWYAQVWFDEGKAAVEERTRRRARKVFKRKQDSVNKEVPPPPRQRGSELQAVELAEHEDAVRGFLITMGMDGSKADLVAAAVVGKMITAVGRRAGADDAPHE